MSFFQFLFYTPLLADLMRFLKKVLNGSSTLAKAGLTLALTDFFGDLDLVFIFTAAETVITSYLQISR